MLLISESIVSAVLSETVFCWDTDLPRKISFSSSAYASGPSFVDKPHLVTMLLASPVALSISFEAPVVTASSPKISSSATLPPKSAAIMPLILSLLLLYLSSSGKNIVTPKALPLGMILTL